MIFPPATSKSNVPGSYHRKAPSIVANGNQTISGLPKLPKAMSTIMQRSMAKLTNSNTLRTFFQTSLKVYVKITEEEKIHDFYFLVRDEALQTFRNRTDATRSQLNDILAEIRRRRYVKQQSIATAKVCPSTPATKRFRIFWNIYKSQFRKRTERTPSNSKRLSSVQKCRRS